MPQRTIVLTGASDGLGALAAADLTRQGDRVLIVGRSPEKTAQVARKTGAEYFVADFARLDDVRRVAAEILEATHHIDVLANNAGGIFGRRELTVDGFEKNFQVNYLAPVLLTELLLDQIVAAKGSVVSTSSESTVRYGDLDIDDLQSEKGFKDERAYANAKIDLILYTRTLHDRMHNHGVSAVAFHPGNLSSNFASGESSWGMIYNSPLKHVFLVSPKKGAKTLLHFIDGKPGVDWQSGQYYQFTKLASTAKTPKQITDARLQQQLAERTAALLHMPTV